MARPKNADSADTVDRILRAARLVLLEQDGIRLEGPMRHIAEVAGVSLGTLQYYFPSRDELLEVCLDDYYVRLEALAASLAQEAVASGLDREAFVRRAARAFYTFGRAEQPALRLRAWLNARQGALPDHRAQNVRDSTLDHIGPLLAVALGIPELEARLAIQTMTFVVMQYALLDPPALERITGPGAPAEALPDHVADVAVRLVFPARGSAHLEPP